MIRWFFFLVSLSSLVAQAQHPFYLQIFEEGKLAMSQGDWQRAAQDLEIAAFGFLEKDALLAEAYVYLVLAHHEMGQPQQKMEFLRDVDPLLDGMQGKPESVELDTWEKFLVVSGRKAPPLPPHPADEKGLQEYLQKYPGNSDAWLALLQVQMAANRTAKARKTVAEALEALPENAQILNSALWFSMTRDGEQGARDLANKLLIVAPSSSLANEYLGVKAAEAGDWENARVFFSAVPNPSLPKTAEYLRQLDQASQVTETEDPTSVETESGQEQVPPESEPEAVLGIPDNEVETARIGAPKETSPEETAETLQTKIKADNDLKVANLEKAVRNNPGDPAYKFQLVSAYIDQGDFKRAKKQLAKLARKHNRNPLYAETYAHFQYAQGSYQTNIDNLAGFENVTGGIAYYLGMSYYQLGQTENAARILKNLDPETYALPAMLSEQETRTPAVDSPRSQTLPSLATMTKEEVISWLKAQADQGNWSEMHTSLAGIDAKFAANPEVRFYKGRTLLEKQLYEEAMPVFIELVSEGYTANEVFYHAGMAAWKRGNLSVAQYLFERAKANNSAHTKEISEILARQLKDK